MTGSFSANFRRPSVGSAIDTWLKKHARHPDSFECGVRVIEGEIPGQRARWRFWLSAVDPYGPPGTIVLHHGSSSTLVLRVERGASPASPSAAARPHHTVLTAVEVDTRARVQLSVPLGEIDRFVDGA